MYEGGPDASGNGLFIIGCIVCGGLFLFCAFIAVLSMLGIHSISLCGK